MSLAEILHDFVLIFAVVDPIGTVPVFIAVTRRHKDWEKRTIAIQASAVAAGILLFFIIAGQFVLEIIGVPLSAFQMAGGIVLFLFALTMIFGPGKTAEELEVVRSGKETAIFPLAVPSIASPGAMMAVVLLTDNHRFSIAEQSITTVVMLIVLLITLGLMLASRWIYRQIGDSGAGIVSRVMGLILSSVAATSVLDGIKTYFTL